MVIGCVATPVREPPVAEPMGDLVTIGNLDIVKNHRYLLAVLDEAKRRGREYSLDVYGEGPLHDDLLRRTRALGLEGQVTFHGFRPGLPVVVGPVGPIPELCDDGVEGRYWPLDDVSRAADILIETLENEPDRARMAQAAQERFRREFDAEVIVPRLTAFLTERFHQAAAAAQ